ncbi:MAG: hypothetical protein HWE22_08285 [Flavobacteriales bacterium]|nr:hypothetical protein [Flavobacteriales bacterium]
MKLIDVLDQTNTIEKSSFYKILNNLIEEGETDEIEEILNKNRHVKEIDHFNINKVFMHLRKEFKKHIQFELASNLSQLDILIDILIRDGNVIMKDRWFHDLYKKEIEALSEASEIFTGLINTESKELESHRRRDYVIYRACVETAYTNDEANNQDKKVTSDEYSLLQTLSDELELSNEEIRLINFSIVPIEPLDQDVLIKNLKDLGIIFYHKKDYCVYVPDEIVKILREIRGKSIADKYLRRVLKVLKGPELNLVCKRHNINQRSGLEEKVKTIINQGISLKSLLKQGIHKEDTKLNDRKKTVNRIMEDLGIESRGSTIEDKIELIVQHFNIVEKDETIGISMDGYELLCKDLNEVLPHINNYLRDEFHFQEKEVLKAQFLADHNIKPRDILDLIVEADLRSFCDSKGVSFRGDEVQNILNSYTDTESIYIENFVNIGNRDLNALKTNNINITSAEIGLKYEEVTRILFRELGFNVNEELKAEVNSSKDKIDILIETGEKEVIIVECKTAKSTKYNKFSACSRQIKSYQKHLEKNGYRVIKTLLVAPDFTPDFIEDCDLDIELNLSLITSETLYNIWNGFKHAPQQVFPTNLLMRDALISDQKILKALKIK